MLKAAVQLTASTVLEYTVPASTTALGVVVQVTNPKSNAARYTLSLYVQASGDANDAAADFFLETFIDPDGIPYQFSIGTMMTGDFIRAKADTTLKLNLRIIGDEAT